MNILNKIIIYLDNDYFPDKTVKIKRFTNVIRDTVFRNIQKEVDTVFRLSKYQEETPLETLFLLVTIKSLRDKYRINQDVIDKYLGIEYDETKMGSLKSWPKMNALVIILLLYYYGNSVKFLKQRYGLNKIILEKFREEPKLLRRKKAELIILLLDLMACPFLRAKDREKICSYMGIGGVPYIDINPYPFPLMNGDTVLLCSDGLYRALSEPEMLRIISSYDNNMQQAAEALTAAAIAKGKRHQDNTTAVLVKYCERVNNSAGF